MAVPMIYGEYVKIGDVVSARHFMPEENRWSDQRRNYLVTSLEPFLGVEQWDGAGGEPRKEWRLSPVRLEYGTRRGAGDKDLRG